MQCFNITIKKILLIIYKYKNSSFGNNVNNIFLKGEFILISKVEICGVNTAKLPVLSNVEKQELLIRIRKASKCTRCYASAQTKVD